MTETKELPTDENRGSIGEIAKKEVLFCNKMSKGTCNMRKM